MLIACAFVLIGGCDSEPSTSKEAIEQAIDLSNEAHVDFVIARTQRDRDRMGEAKDKSLRACYLVAGSDVIVDDGWEETMRFAKEAICGYRQAIADVWAASFLEDRFGGEHGTQQAISAVDNYMSSIEDLPEVAPEELDV